MNFELIWLGITTNCVKVYFFGFVLFLGKLVLRWFCKFGMYCIVLLADDMSSSQIIIESNSKSWIEAIKDAADQSPWRLINFVESARQAAESSVGMSFNWVCRIVNNAAHELTKWSLNNSVYGSFNMGHSQCNIGGSCPV